MARDIGEISDSGRTISVTAFWGGTVAGSSVQITEHPVRQKRNPGLDSIAHVQLSKPEVEALITILNEWVKTV